MFSTLHLHIRVPVAEPSVPGRLLFRQNEIGKAEHIGHEALLLAVVAGNSQYVLSLVIPAQQKMTEILISIHNKAVAAEAAVFSA